MTARRQPAIVLPEQPEDDFQDSVISLLKMAGWPPELIYHTFDSRRSRAGFPDIVAVKPSDGRLLIAELKRDSANPTPAQQRWLDALDTVRHFDVHLWRPRDTDKIVRTIR